jgi:hypothetical protein
VKPERIKVGGRWVEPIAFDPNPLYACHIERGLVPSNPGIGVVHSWMAFDPRYGPENEDQIEWHINHGTPGAETWEIGKPAAPFA